MEVSENDCAIRDRTSVAFTYIRPAFSLSPLCAVSQMHKFLSAWPLSWSSFCHVLLGQCRCNSALLRSARISIGHWWLLFDAASPLHVSCPADPLRYFHEFYASQGSLYRNTATSSAQLRRCMPLSFSADPTLSRSFRCLPPIQFCLAGPWTWHCHCMHPLYPAILSINRRYTRICMNLLKAYMALFYLTNPSRVLVTILGINRRYNFAMLGFCMNHSKPLGRRHCMNPTAG
jgi:hypothetical protein